MEIISILVGFVSSKEAMLSKIFRGDLYPPEFFILNGINTCTSGYSGIRWATTTFRTRPFFSNGENGWIWGGCGYRHPGEDSYDVEEMVLLMQPEEQAGETYDHGIGDIAAATQTFVGVESVTVPAGTFDTLRIELVVHGDGNSCSYKTTFWLAKGIGPVKIHRTDAILSTAPAACSFAIRMTM